MADYTTYKNTPLTVNVEDDYADSGWRLSDGEATHMPCNPGYLLNNNINIEPGKTYVIEYELENKGSGFVRASIGSKLGPQRSLDGFYKDVISEVSSNVLSFYAEGLLTIKNVKVYTETVEPVTIAFSEDADIWTSYYSYHPDIFVNFIDKFFTFKSGSLWIHNKNEVRNNFYGVQFKSEVEFFVNNNPTAIKIFYSMRLQSNRKWSSPDNDGLVILPTEGKPEGMWSRLKMNRFKNLQGDFFADFLRNTLDPRFDNPDIALFKGEPLRGRIMKVKLENSDSTEVILFQVDIKSAPANYTY